MVPSVIECEIEPCLQSSLFDHKAVKLSFKKINKKVIRNPKISNKILGDPDIAIIVETAVLETYLINLNPEESQRPVWVNGLMDVGRIKTLLRSAGPHASYLTPEGAILRENNLIMIRQILSRYDLPTLEAANLTCNPSVFYEVLLNNLRNEVTGYQYFVPRKQSCRGSGFRIDVAT